MSDEKSNPLVVAVCGASGQIYARWVLKLLLDTSKTVHLIVSEHAKSICNDELQLPDIAHGLTAQTLKVHDNALMDSPLASGSYKTAGMIVCPCTLNTLAALASGISDNLIRRAGQVHIKQRRPLLLALRETPLSLIDLENMVRLARAGVVVAPLSPSFYHRPQTLDDLARFTAERLLEMIGAAETSYYYPGPVE